MMKEGVGKTGEEIIRSRRVKRKDRGENLVILLYFSTPIIVIIREFKDNVSIASVASHMWPFQLS
jgi:hypothetical protein